LQDVQPIAAKTVETRILGNSRHLRRDGFDFPAIFDTRPLLAGRRKRHLHIIAAGTDGVVTQRGFIVVDRRNSHRSLSGQMQNRRQMNVAVRVERPQQRGATELRIELQNDRFGRIALRPAGNQCEAVGVETDRPASGRRGDNTLSAIFHARVGSFGIVLLRSGGCQRRLQRAGSKLAMSQAIDRQRQELRPQQRDLRLQIPALGNERVLALGDHSQRRHCHQCHRYPGITHGWLQSFVSVFLIWASLGYTPNGNFPHVTKELREFPVGPLILPPAT
jgi:hypothetical protein